MLVPCLPYSSTMKVPKRLLTFNGLHGVISQKIELFIIPLSELYYLMELFRYKYCIFCELVARLTVLHKES
jgi:hypothetical protein